MTLERGNRPTAEHSIDASDQLLPPLRAREEVSVVPKRRVYESWTANGSPRNDVANGNAGFTVTANQRSLLVGSEATVEKGAVAHASEPSLVSVESE
jgi:hypothetical protein